MTEPRKIILDCDPGYDDAAAIILAAGSPAVKIIALTTVAGNQTIEKVTSNALRIARLDEANVLGRDRSASRQPLAPLGALERVDQPIDLATGLQTAERCEGALARLAGFVAKGLDQARIAPPSSTPTLASP